MKTAIITGITGQDGAYLSQFLLDKQYRVIGLVRSLKNHSFPKLNYLGIGNAIEIIECDLLNLQQINDIITKFAPNEIYNLAAQSSVSNSFSHPKETLQFNILSVLNLLETIRTVDKSIKFYQASSSEMFGKVNSLPITENSLLHPLSPYAISKVAAHHTTVNYRESYQLFACSGILFNHESYLRDEGFFMKKLIKGALDVWYNKIEQLTFGNLDIKRDFGYSKEYVQAMWLMLQQDKPEDFLICSGTSLSLREIVEYVFNYLQIPLSKYTSSTALFRPTEIENIYGTNSKAKTILGWACEPDFFVTLDKLIEEEKRNYAV